MRYPSVADRSVVEREPFEARQAGQIRPDLDR